MISSFVILFRETLEAALIVTILLAASRGVPLRGRYIGGGLIAGLFGAGIVAALADTIAAYAEGMGTELFNATILFLAVPMLAWHQVWMSQHGAELARESKMLGKDVAAGSKPLSALAVITAIAVLREGSETVLFLYGIAADGQSGAAGMLTGGLAGIIGAALFGWLLYLGLLKVSLKHIFKVTGVLVTFLAAGLASQGAAYLVQAGVLPPLGTQLWDTSWLLTEDGPVGQLFHILFGYVAQPQGIQLLFYAVTLMVIMVATNVVSRMGQNKFKPSAQAA